MQYKFNYRKLEKGYKVELLNEKGEFVASSQLYTSMLAARNASRSIAFNFPRKNIESLVTKGKKYFFSLRSPNGEVLLISKEYASKSDLDSELSDIVIFYKSKLKNISIKPEYRKKNAEEDLVKSVGGFLKALDSVSRDEDYVYFYRGHSKSSYILEPSIYRNQGWLGSEHLLFKELMLKCPNDFSGINDSFQCLVKMQHYSLPTRLLDVTSNPLMALYFAIGQGNSEGNGEVVMFAVPKAEVKYYDSDTVSVLANLSKVPLDLGADSDDDVFIHKLWHEIRKERPYFENNIVRNDLDKVVCVRPKLDNARVIRQDGAFFLFGMSGKKAECAEIKSDYIIKRRDGSRIIIDGSKRSQIRGQLETLGITRASIYPEIESVAGYIKENYKY